MIECYVGLGGNFQKTLWAIKHVIAHLKKNVHIKKFKVSKLYRTSAVSDIPQEDYLNAVCRFETDLTLDALWEMLCSLERALGKKDKPKNAPRLIDLDLLFYGSTVTENEKLTVPHPRWHERLFVLMPLSDVTEEVPVSGGLSVKQLLERFLNPHQEKISVFEGEYAQN